jgi:hypothetical protein
MNTENMATDAELQQLQWISSGHCLDGTTRLLARDAHMES